MSKEVITLALRRSDYARHQWSQQYFYEAIYMMEGKVRLETEEMVVVDFPCPPSTKIWIILANLHFWSNIR